MDKSKMDYYWPGFHFAKVEVTKEDLKRLAFARRVIDKLQEALQVGECEKLTVKLDTLDPQLLLVGTHYMQTTENDSRADGLFSELKEFDAWLDDYLREHAN